MATELIINTDGGSRGNPGPAALGVTVRDASGQVVYERGEVLGTATNNEAEYHAVLHSLTWLQTQLAAQPDVIKVTWKLDSKLVVEQLLKHWKIKEPRMLALAQQCWAILTQLKIATHFQHVPRAENKRADELVNQALDAAAAS